MEQHFSVRSLQRNSSNVFDTVEDARNTHYALIPLRDADIRYYSCFFEQETADRYFQTLLREAAWEQRTLFVFGKHRLEPRLTAWYGDEGASYSYSGTTRHPKPWTPLLREIKQRVENAAGVCYNSLLLNQYRDGNDSVSWHSDDEDGVTGASGGKFTVAAWPKSLLYGHGQSESVTLGKSRHIFSKFRRVFGHSLRCSARGCYGRSRHRLCGSMPGMALRHCFHNKMSGSSACHHP
jgi:hypothetical protein